MCSFSDLADRFNLFTFTFILKKNLIMIILVMISTVVQREGEETRGGGGHRTVLDRPGALPHGISSYQVTT